MRGTILGILGLCLGTFVGCESNDRGEGAGGSGGASSGGKVGLEEGEGGVPSSGAGGASDGAGGAACECKEGDEGATLSLECACEAGLCHDFEGQLEITEAYEFSAPYYVRLGSCDEGITALEWQEGTENSGSSYFDAQGGLLYESSGGYVTGFGFGGQRPYDCPEVDFGGYSFGTRTELSGCKWCLVEKDDPGSGLGGAGGNGDGVYDRWTDIPDCELAGDGRPLPPGR